MFKMSSTAIPTWELVRITTFLISNLEWVSSRIFNHHRYINRLTEAAGIFKSTSVAAVVKEE